MLSIDLPNSTGDCDHGPIVAFRHGELHVWYDHDDDWTHIRVGSCVAVRFTPSPSVTGMMIEAYSKVIEHPDSRWLSELRSAADSREQLSPDFRHIFVYFDHYGCLEFVARSVTVEENSEAPPNFA